MITTPYRLKNDLTDGFSTVHLDILVYLSFEQSCYPVWKGAHASFPNGYCKVRIFKCLGAVLMGSPV